MFLFQKLTNLLGALRAYNGWNFNYLLSQKHDRALHLWFLGTVHFSVFNKIVIIVGSLGTICMLIIISYFFWQLTFCHCLSLKDALKKQNNMTLLLFAVAPKLCLAVPKKQRMTKSLSWKVCSLQNYIATVHQPFLLYYSGYSRTSRCWRNCDWRWRICDSSWKERLCKSWTLDPRSCSRTPRSRSVFCLKAWGLKIIA